MNEYKDLMDAVRILSNANIAIGKEDGPAVMSPAWRMTMHAMRHLERQADTAMRGK